MTKTRPIRERLTRERIVDAALEIMDAEGLDAVTMRHVARQVGVEAMSLYNHVRDKEDLLSGVRERVLSEFEDPGIEGPWEERAREAARSWRNVLRAHPNMLSLISEAKTLEMTPGSSRPSEVSLRLIREAGLPEDEAVKAYCAFGGYIVGFVMFEVATTRATRSGANAPNPQQLVAALPPTEFPCLLESLPHLINGDLDERFEYGLDLLLAGLRAKLPVVA